MRLYLDACAIIYAHEGVEDCRAAVIDWLSKAAAPDSVVMTSSLSRLECRVKPIHDKNTALLDAYDRFFARRSLTVLPISDAVLDRAAVLRTEINIRTPDAIHIASAALGLADVFLTNDASLQRCKDVNVVILE